MASPGPILSIDPRLPLPVYRQVIDGLRAMLVNGRFSPGEQLPTVRELAIELGVHHNTVASAYRELAEEGWLELARRRGATVRDRAVPRAVPKRVEEHWGQRLQELVAQGLSSGVSTEAVTRALTELANEVAAAQRRKVES